MKDLNTILQSDIQQYIKEHLHDDLGQFLLKKSPFPEVSIQDLAQQIKGQQIAQKKFPFLYQKGIVFPPHLNIEQASSQETAQAKTQYLSGKSFLDLTCGFGIDAYFLSQNFEEITLVEQNSQLSEIVKHNWQVLGRKAHFINDNLENFLENNQQKFDLIYLDPARRDQQNNKKFLLEDLSPNILEIQNELLEISDNVMIKLSPLIDLTYLQNSLRNLQKIEIIALKNEVKEVVIYLNKKYQGQTEIIARNIATQEPDFSFFSYQERETMPIFSDVLAYLYIPNNAVLKSGAFNLIAQRFNLKKLHPNTHIYTADEHLENFCGRVFEVEEISAKSLKKGEKYNIISKNYPLSPEQIKSKYKLKDGGKNYLFFTQSAKGKVILKSQNKIG